MNRRHFIGVALCATAAPVFAKRNKSDIRTLAFHHLHTEEKISVIYRIGEHYQRSALHKLNHFLRDFRTKDSVAMDPKLFDLLYDVKRRIGDPDGFFEVLSAYRSPRTNAMLRRTSGGVAKRSLHMTGKAIDIRFEDTSTRRIRDCALALQRGGVGYYARSDFVHLDTGTPRRWGA